MTAAYVDSSCLVAVLFEEASSRGLARVLRRYDQLFASNLLEAEVRAAAARERLADLPETALRSILWVLPDRPLSDEIGRALKAGYLRGADLWHVAHALFVQAEFGLLDFLTLDRRQAEVVSKLGMKAPLPAR